MTARSLFKFLLLFLGIPLLLYLLQFNIRLYYQPTFSQTEGKSVCTDVLKQLRFLKNELDAGAGTKMQQAYPEGFLFLHALYGLAWCNLLQDQPHQSDLYAEGLQEIDRALLQTRSTESKAVFSKDLLLEYGAFYQGWTNYLLGQKLALQKPEERDTVEVFQYKNACRRIATAFDASSIPYLSSYAYGIWPADNVVCIAVLAQHDRLFGLQHEAQIEKWLERVKTTLGPGTGLIPHESKPNGTFAEGARGSSQSLMLTFLVEIDSVFAQDQFGKYLKQFLDYRLGLPGIREYPMGHSGAGDIDSGPVVFDIGGAASIVGIAATERLGRPDLSVQIRNAVEGIGCPLGLGQTKQYFFGQEPMADAFLAWAHSFTPRPDPAETSNWRWAFHGWSLLIALSLFGLYRLFLWLAR